MTQLATLITTYFQTNRGRYSRYTQASQRHNLDKFMRWCERQQATTLADMTRSLLEQYPNYLFDYRKADNQPLSKATQAQQITNVRHFFHWLSEQHYLYYNPASELALPHIDILPKQILTEAEIEHIISQPNTQTPHGLRDRAILETFYSTAMRRQELQQLKIPDLNTDQGTVRIRNSKGGKDRVIPIGQRAMDWIDRYLITRFEIAPDPDDGTLFLSHRGQHLTLDWLSRIAKKYFRQANIHKPGSCHLFRHSCATLMLENGADICYIQALLGHKALSTTERYTHVAIHKLKAVHTQTHPARLQPRQHHD